MSVRLDFILFSLFFFFNSLAQQAKFESVDSLFRSKDYEAAIVELNQIIASFSSDSTILSEAYFLLGKCHSRIKNDTLALDFYLKSLTIREQIDDKNAVAQTLFRLGVFFAEKHRTDQAESYLYRCRDIYQELNNHLWVDLTNLSLGNVAFEKGDFDKAILIFDTLAQSQYLKEKPQYLAMIANNSANAHKKIKRYDQALKKFLEAVRIYESEGKRRYLLSVYYNIGLLYNLMNQADSAKHYLNESTELAFEYKDYNSVKKAYFELSKTYDFSGDFENALSYYKQYDSLKNQMSNIEISQQIAELQTKYETEKKEKEIITQKAQIQQSAAEKKQLYFALAGLLLLLGAAILIYTQRSKNLKLINRKNKELHSREVNQLLVDQELKAFDAMIEGQEKERKRVAEELHDRLGMTLSATKMHFEALQGTEVKEDQVDYIKKMLDTAIEDTRQISHNMLSGVLTKFGLIAALKDLKDTIQSSDKLKFSLKTIQIDERLDNEKEINLYRITQELLSNTLKHADASHFEVCVERKNGNIELLVTDDGKGLSTENKGDGIGMKNIDSRVKKMGGSWQMDSSAGQGTKTTVTIPI